MNYLIDVIICDICNDVAFLSKDEFGYEIVRCDCDGDLFRNGEND